MLMAGAKLVIVSLEIPPEFMPMGGPEHEVGSDFNTRGICRSAVFVCVNPLGAGAEHELEFRRYVPRLLEQNVGAPFRRVSSE